MHYLVMLGTSVLLVSAATAPAVASGAVNARQSSTATGEASTHVVPVATGQILGVVTDRAGAPVDGVLVSATGPSGATVVVCDAEGRFEFRSLQPGPYLLRTHRSGYVASRRHVVVVEPDVPTVRSLTLRQQTDTNTPVSLPAVFEAGFGATDTLVAQPDLEFDTNQDEPITAAPPVELAPHEHGTKAWRLRHTKRSVLKDATGHVHRRVSTEHDSFKPPERWTMALRPPLWGADHGAGLGDGFPITGEVQLLARTTVDSPGELWSVDALPGQVAYVSLGAPVGEGAWAARGALDMASGDASSWAVAGSYVADPHEDHAVEFGMSYSVQRRAAMDDSGLLVRPDASSGWRSRDVGGINAFDTWSVSPQLTVGYGASFARYGYLEDGKLFSPRAHVTLMPARRTRVRVAWSQRMTAPGAEEFLPPVSGVWLPPERTFAPLSPVDPLQAERARHLEVALERNVGGASVVSVRRFRQQISDQLITMFGVRADALGSSREHYYLASATGVDADGWGVTFSYDLAGRLRSAIDYSIVRASWAPWTAAGLLPRATGAFRAGTERFHDVTASIESEIPETSTWVFALYRINTAFTRTDQDVMTSGLDARFDLRVTQPLPFSPFGGGSWEVLVALRSLFHEQALWGSAYDELLVVSPPKQFVGGLVVHF